MTIPDRFELPPDKAKLHPQGPAPGMDDDRLPRLGDRAAVPDDRPVAGRQGRDDRGRVREEGHVFTGEALVVPRDEDDLVERIEGAARMLAELDWRFLDVVVVPVSSLDKRPDAPEPQVSGAASAPDG